MPLKDKAARLKYQREYHARRLKSDPEFAERQRKHRRTWMATNSAKMTEYQKAYRRKRAADHYRTVTRPKLYPGYRPPGDVCEACGNKFDTKLKEPHLDHNHKTGAFRGWLCRGCNVALGCLRDDPETILRLHRYACL